MRWSWFGEFFGALPDAFRALYQFGDPSNVGQGWWGIVIALIWGVLIIAVPLSIARVTYQRREWVSATMGVVGGLGVLWWVFGILPSAWIYFVDSNKEILEDRIIPTSFTFTLGGVNFPVATNLYDVIRDVVVVVEHLIAFGILFWAAIAIQKRLPKTMVPGEQSREPGGYR
ncbi:MAG TPA: hypothetical protein VHF25_09870 [Nitriliruptorales bacterium]|nr:hypothetical protein [Nitriliruptorales bacterium]